MEQLALFGLGEVKFLDEYSIRADYESLLDRFARLTSYVRSSPKNLFWPIIDRQNELAEDDLVIFALRSRRFISATSLQKLARNIPVPLGPIALGWDYKKWGERNLWEVMNVIIHHEEITILRSKKEFDAVGKVCKRIVDIKDLINDYSNPTRPFIMVESDHDRFGFDLCILINIFQNRFLRSAINSCDKRGIELTEFKSMTRKLIEAFPNQRDALNDLLDD